MLLRPVLAAAAAAIALGLGTAAAQDAPKPYVPPTPAANDAPKPGAAASPAVPATLPAADPASTAAAVALPTQIEDVQVVGPWSDGGTSGVWRTVMLQTGGTDKDRYRFFVQKLDRVGPGAKVLATTEVREVAGVDGAVVGYRADEPDAEGEATTTDDTPPAASDLTLFFDIVPASGEIPETYELHLQKDLTYTFGPASN